MGAALLHEKRFFDWYNPCMDKITVEGYRCFRERQSARLAPLTLLVGNNSTGKTSFLALIRALWEVAFLSESPDFQKDPYDLGTFRDIAHNRGGRGGQVSSFEASFEYRPTISVHGRTHRWSDEITRFYVTFEERGAVPFPVVRQISEGRVSLRAEIQKDKSYHFQYQTDTVSGGYPVEQRTPEHEDVQLLTFTYLLGYGHGRGSSYRLEKGIFSDDTITLYETEIALKDMNRIRSVARSIEQDPRLNSPRAPYAGAPVRSRPRRTYDPVRPSLDPEGEYIPTYLANVSRGSQKDWRRLKTALEHFGESSGMFDEITIKSLGQGQGSPFQVGIRKFGKRLKGPSKNLIDVGYGVSQILPVITELLRDGSTQMFLLQQPEVHLHPSAQAALGSLFCDIAAEGKQQIIVETHSDHLLDRLRIEVREGEVEPKDVSILFFEQGELDVNIHSIRLDENGNVLDAPPSYRQFFMEETRRSIGL